MTNKKLLHCQINKHQEIDRANTYINVRSSDVNQL